MKELIEYIKSDDINAKQRIEEDSLKYLIYNGRLREVIIEKILSEFKEKKTVQELKNRIVPINIVKKMIDKLGKIYKANPIRRPLDRLPADQDLIDMYSRSFNIDQYMQYANKLFKLHKHVLLEPYLDANKVPRLRAIPSNSFWLFSDDKINPEKMTKVVVLLKDSKEDIEQVYSVWTNEEHWLINGRGEILRTEMQEMNNPDGINPYGVLPFIHINESIDLLYPIRPTDMLSVQFAICLLLSDSTLAQKYLSWGTLAIIGGDGQQDIEVGAGAIINLPSSVDGSTPSVQYIQPNLNSDEVLRLVDKLVEYLLSTNNLSAGSMTGGTTGNNVSGISKLIDNAESTEDREEQKKIFEDAEKKLWDLFAHYILPVWNKSDIHPEYKGAFSQTFELDIYFKEVRPMVTEKEQIEIVITKLNNGLITLKGALKEINPSLSDDGVEALMIEIQDEKMSRVEAFQMVASGQEQQEDTEEDLADNE